MCKECGKYECPPTCPGFVSPREITGQRCEWCEEYYGRSDILRIGGKSYCSDCVSEMTVNDIIRISEICDIKEFVDLIEGRLVRCI